MFLVIFASLNRGDRLEDRGISPPMRSSSRPAGLAVIMATFTNLATDLAIMRDSGVLKRLRGTPLPASAFVAGKIGQRGRRGRGRERVTLVVAGLAFGAPSRPATRPGWSSRS